MKRFIMILFVSFALASITGAVTKTAIKPSELNPVILKDIQSRYPGWLIMDAFKINNKNVISYEVILQKRQVRTDLYYDKDGNFLRKKDFSVSRPNHGRQPVKH